MLDIIMLNLLIKFFYIINLNFNIMKKLLLFVIACTLGLFGAVNAQETVLIGDEVNTATSMSNPFDIYYGYGISQQLYTADEINHAAGTISGIAVKFKGDGNEPNGAYERKVAVYINSTDLETIPYGEAKNVPTGQVANFDGTITYVPENWATFNFTTPFQYDGGNILITMYDYTGKSAGNGNYSFYTNLNEDATNYKVSNKGALPSTYNAYNIEDYIAIGSVFSTTKERNIIQLTFGAVGEGGGEEPTPEQPETQEPVVVTIDGTVGEYAANASNELPFNTNYHYTTSQQIYLAEELGITNGSTITNVAFNVKTTLQTQERNIKIYMVNTETSRYMSNYPILVNESDLVYDGKITIDANAKWYDLKLDKAFAYTGNNVLLCVYDYTGTDTDKNTTFNTYNAKVKDAEDNFIIRSVYKRASGSFDPTLESTSTTTFSNGGSLPQVQFTCLVAGGGEEPTPEPEPETPVAPAAPVVTVETVTETTVTLTWEAVDGATSYNIYTPNNYAGSNVLGLEATTYTFEGLTAGTEYCFEVSSVNTVDESDATKACATTTAAVVEENGVKIVGDGATTNDYMPMNTYYKHSLCQQIYTAAELGLPVSEISKIAFSQQSNKQYTRNIEIYMVNTTKASFDSNSDWVNISEADKVFSGVIFTTEGWNEFELNTPFQYDGENIMICVVDKTGAYQEGSIWVANVAGASQALYVCHDSYVFDPFNLSDINNSGKYVYCQPYNLQMKVYYEASSSDVKVTPETIALGNVQVGEYWSENEATTVAVKVKPIVTTISSITCDNDFFVLPTIDLTASTVEFEVAYNKNAAAGEQTGNLTITYGDGATKVVPMTATAYAPATADVFELAQEITFTENAYTDTPVFANLKDDYNLPKEANKGNTPDAVYTFTLEKEMNVTVDVNGTNAIAAIYKEDFNGEGGPMVKNNYKGNVPAPAGPTTFFYDFENADLSDFTLRDANNDGKNWSVLNPGIEGNFSIVSYSYQNYNITPDNYIITNESYAITENSKLTYLVTSSWTEHYAVVIIENGVETIVFEEDVKVQKATKEVDLSEYAGKLVQIALRHYNCTGQFVLYIDNLQLTDGNITSSVEPLINVPYPAGKYYLVAAAEDAFTVNVAIEALESEPVIPAAPVVEAEATSDSTITLTWNEVENALSYNIYSADTLVANVTETSYTVLGLEADTEYSFIVAAVRNEQEVKSEEKTAKTLPAETEEPTDPETPSTDNNRLVSVTQDNNWENLTYVYESQTSNKVLRVLKGVDQGYGMYVTVLEYDDNGVIIGSEYKWLENGALTSSNYIDEYEYTYTEGVLTSYTQASGDDYYGTPTPVEYVLTYDANGNVETVVYGTNKVVYTYEDGKLVKEVMSYVMNGVEETEYEIDYAYENGNCISATQYSVLEGERIARKATEYFYDLTVEAEDVFSFVYPHEVKPASVNVLTKELSYEYQEDYFSGAITKSNIKILTYNYNFAVESVSFPPMGLSARAISDTEIELSWVATEETEKFAVYQNDTYIGESESTYFTVEGLTANTEYCFTVKGVNGEVESEASEAACAKTMDVVSVDPTTIAFGELRLGEYWSESEVTVGVSINRLGKTITSITCDDAFFTLPTDIDLTSEYIWFEMGYDKTAAAGEYTATLTVTLESGVTVEIPVTATAYAPATPDVFELAQEVTFTEGVYTDTPDFATLHDDYAMPNENEWDETDAPDAVYSFTLEEESVVSVSVTGDNAAYAIFQAEGFEAPYEGNVFTGEVKNLNTEFVYNFDNNSLADFTIVDNDEYKDFTWAIEEGEKGYQLVSYSYYGWYTEDNSYTYIDKADERLITNNAYPISAKSVLSFDMNVNGTFEEIIIEVTKDGETFTEIEKIEETSYSYDWLAKSVNVGEKFAELGLEYGDYQIVLYHKANGVGKLNIDNLVLAERVRTYPVGEYYLFAAAESAFTVEVNATPAKDVTFEPEIPVAKAYRLESIESFNVESYVYDEIYTNRVLSYVGSDGLDNILTYNKAGQLETVKSVSIIEGEEPQVISSIEYEYNEDGTLASYSESSPHPVTGAMFTTTTEYTYENGRLVKAENADYEVETTLGYNEDGTVKEIVESYMTTIMTYENGKLVKKAYGYEDEETGEFVTDAEDIYTYDANGNCVKQESYEYGKLYQVYEFYYDVKIAAEDVYSFELPHLAMTNVEPSSNNILVKKLSYYSYFNEEVGEVLTHSYDVTIYHYNPAVEMAPITPINLVAEVVDGVVELTWEKFIDAETFTVYQDGEIIAQNVEEGAYTVEDLEAGEYCFAVRAYNKTGASATTEEVCIEIKESGDDPVVPEAPVVTPEATSDSTIVLTWAAVDGATNYNVYSADTLVANVTETTYTVTGLEAEKEYCFNVTAVNEVGGESAKSENACATTLKEGNAPVVLEAPVVQVVEITETTIVIAWNQVESATNYKVFANDQLITTLPDTIAGFRELTPNTEYCFTVVAINEVGDESAPSEKVCATTSGEGIAENAAAFNIYPNPVADKLFIETEATVEEVTIYTLTGVMIYSEVDYNNNTINVSDLSGGVYFIKVRTDNGEVVKRFIKK